MTAASLSSLLLAARLRLASAGPLRCAALALCVLGVASWAWVVPQRARQQQLEQLEHVAQLGAGPVKAAPTAVLASAAAPASADQNLALFYATLGDRRYAEQQVKTLFDLAAKAGLTLAQGEYKAGYDKPSRVSTYQVVLPVKGTYQAISQFGLAALRAVPFASLDELSFKREKIDDTMLDARLRLTFYLKDVAVNQ